MYKLFCYSSPLWRSLASVGSFRGGWKIRALFRTNESEREGDGGETVVFKRAVPIPEKPGKNWVEHVKGKLPDFIKRVAAHIFTSQGRIGDSKAYAGAISQIKKWAAKGNKKAIAALAQWEKLKAQAAAYSAAKKSDDKEPEPLLSDAELIEAITGDKPSAGDLAWEPGDKVFENFAFDEGEAKKAYKAKKSPGSLRWVEQQVRARLMPPVPTGTPEHIEREYYFVRDVFADKVIVEVERVGTLLQFPYTVENNGLVLGDPIEVVQEYVPLDQSQSTNAVGGATSAA